MSTEYGLLLEPESWDLFVDNSGNIACCYAAYSITQAVANACRLFTNDAYYDQDKGIPHFAIELKDAPALNILRARLKEAALNVDGVKDAQVLNLSISDRKLTGQIALVLEDGTLTELSL